MTDSDSIVHLVPSEEPSASLVPPLVERSEEAILLSIRHWTLTTGFRYRREAPYSGEQFRDDILHPLFEEARRDHKPLVIDMDGTYGYGPSFIEEAFGGLIRHYPVSADDVLNTISLISEDDPFLEEEVRAKVENAASEKAHPSAPKKRSLWGFRRKATGAGSRTLKRRALPNRRA